MFPKAPLPQREAELRTKWVPKQSLGTREIARILSNPATVVDRSAIKTQ